MNYEIWATKDASLFLGAAEADDFQSPSSGMDQVVHLDACAPFRSGSTFWHLPFVIAVRQAVTFSVASHMDWLNLIAFQAKPCLATASNSGRQSLATAEVLERSMDIALGMRASCQRTTASSLRN